MRYDPAGNLKTDTYSGAAVTRVYDAENRMTSETQANLYEAGSYSYDGEGRRVKRIANGTEIWQVYGLGGELLAEYAPNGAAASPQKEYGYRNGQLLITAAIGTGWGSPPTLHDNPLVVAPAIAATTVQSRHITELRTAIDALRTHLGMSAFSWQQPAATGDWIKADPILEMRTALDQALGAPSGGYSAGLAQGLPIKAIHIQELRDRVLAAWSSGSSTQVNWMVTDQLGTPRMIFDQTGSLANMKRHDYLPFGEELGAGQGPRTAQQGYVTDNVRQKFTSKERDNETGLDYFINRYYASTQGRFTSPDPLMASAHASRPQTWNRYSYAHNNPLKYVDPDGMKPVFGKYKDLTEDERRILDNSKVTVGKDKNAQTLSGQALYDYMANSANKMQKQLAGFLNQTAGLADIKFSNGRNALSYVKSVTGFTQERIYATVEGSLHTEMEKISAKKATDGVRFIGPEGQAVDHKGGETNYDVTFRENTPSGAQQLSFASANYELMDKDTDEHCFDCDDAGANVAHVLDGIGHHIPLIGRGGSDPKDIYGRLQERGIKPSYKWED